MCDPMTLAVAAMAGGKVLGGFAEKSYQDNLAAQSRLDALGEKDAAQAQAERIMKAAERQRGAARAATAASGAAIDEFALGVEQEILAAGETDAAMTVLTGERRARTLNYQADMQKAAGKGALVGSLFDAAGTAFGGWKGTAKPADSYHSADWWKGGSGWEGE
jgi:hypothetical protein